jgi:hypothetical protein
MSDKSSDYKLGANRSISNEDAQILEMAIGKDETKKNSNSNSKTVKSSTKHSGSQKESGSQKDESSSKKENSGSKHSEPKKSSSHKEDSSSKKSSSHKNEPPCSSDSDSSESSISDYFSNCDEDICNWGVKVFMLVIVLTIIFIIVSLSCVDNWMSCHIVGNDYRVAAKALLFFIFALLVVWVFVSFVHF